MKTLTALKSVVATKVVAPVMMKVEERKALAAFEDITKQEKVAIGLDLLATQAAEEAMLKQQAEEAAKAAEAQAAVEVEMKRLAKLEAKAAEIDAKIAELITRKATVTKEV